MGEDADGVAVDETTSMPATSRKQSLVWQAFFNQYNLILLGGAGLLAVALASLRPLEVALVGEGAWLLGAARLPVLRRWLAGLADRDAALKWRAAETHATSGLAGDAAARVRALGQRLETLERMARERGVNGPRGGGDDWLMALFQAGVRLAHAEEKLAATIGAGRRTASEEIAGVEPAIVAETDPLSRMSLRQRLLYGQRRLRQVEHLERTLTILQSRSSALLVYLAHLQAHSAGGAALEELEAELEQALIEADVESALDPEAVRALAGRVSAS